MGISGERDRVKLPAFCRGESELKDDKRAEMKRNLSAIMEASKSRRLSQTTVKKGKTTPPKNARKATLKFEILFKYYVKALVTKPRGLNRVVECEIWTYQDTPQKKNVF